MIKICIIRPLLVLSTFGGPEQHAFTSDNLTSLHLVFPFLKAICFCTVIIKLYYWTTIHDDKSLQY